MIQYKNTFWRRIPVKYVLTASAWRKTLPGSPDAFPLEATPEMSSSTFAAPHGKIIGKMRGKPWEKIGKSTINGGFMGHSSLLLWLYDVIYVHL